VDVPASWAEQHGFTEGVDSQLERLRGHDSYSETDPKLLTLIEAGTREMQRLWDSGAQTSLRRLGYAFHVIPRTLTSQERFFPEERFLPEVCFKNIRAYWRDYSAEFKDAFCATWGRSLAEVDAMLAPSNKPEG